MREAYPSDLTDAQWELLEELFPQAATGRPREVNIRDVIDAIFYVDRTGVQWRYLPHDFPRWDLVYSYFRKWGRDGTWDRVLQVLREGVRVQAGREPTPSMACVDSQSVKGTECGVSRERASSNSTACSGERRPSPNRHPVAGHQRTQ